MKVKHLKKPTKQELLEELTTLCIHKQTLDNVFSQLDKAFDTTGSPMFEAVYMAFDFTCDLFCNRHDVLIDDLNWFIYDNEMGAAELECEVVVNGLVTTVEIRSIEDFVDSLKS